MREGKHRILVLDDEESIRRTLRAYLEDEGFEVIATGTGEEALETLSHSHADVAIVDIRLPGMNGNTFIERAHDLRPEMTFIIFTGSVGYQAPVSFQAMGIDDRHVFKKPLSDMSVLAAAVRRLLRRKRGQ
jgi:two-component system, OmpR family, response regulator